MNDLRKAARQALETLQWHLDQGAWGADIEGVTAALRAALVEHDKEYERGVIDGRHRQAQSSVDRAVNRMSAAGHGMTWPGLASSSNGGNDD